MAASVNDGGCSNGWCILRTEMQTFYELPSYSAILSLLDSVLAEINLGLMIYHVPSDDDRSAAKFIYANAEASRCTGFDMTDRVGKRILEAFPRLADTDVPDRFLEVARSGRATKLDPVRYRDGDAEERVYRVRAFPMPLQCVGVIFERIEQ